MVETIELDIPFVAGKERSRVSRNGGKVHQYTPKTTKANMNIIRKVFMQSVDKRGLKVPKDAEVSIEINAYSLMPKSRPKRVQSEANLYKPDTDNIAKLVMDALNGVAYDDDKQVTELYVRKHRRQRKETPNTSEYMKVVITYHKVE